MIIILEALADIDSINICYAMFHCVNQHIIWYIKSHEYQKLYMIFLFVLSSMANDLEQINSLDKVILHDDESSFITTPTAVAQKHGIISIKLHKRHGRHCHENHHCNHGDYHGHGIHSHCDKMSRKKDTFGHYIFKKHYVYDKNLSPTDDAYVPYYSMHYPSFPFSGKTKVSEFQDESEDDGGDKFIEKGLFH